MVYILTSLLINSKADVEVSRRFECDEFGDIGVNGGDRSLVCERFLLVPATTCLNVGWFELLEPRGSNCVVIITLNSRSLQNVLCPRAVAVGGVKRQHCYKNPLYD